MSQLFIPVTDHDWSFKSQLDLLFIAKEEHLADMTINSNFDCCGAQDLKLSNERE